jgi:DNA polymerase-4
MNFRVIFGLMERRVIHLNVADFAVAVERVADRRLRTRAVIVAQGDARAVVYDMSDEAYRDGVRKGMPLTRAKRLARTAAVVPPKLDLYERAMKALTKHVLPFSPLIEHGGWDGHVFLDVTGVRRLFGPPQDIAQSIRKSVTNGISLTPIWAVASNKLASKVATRLVKPAGEYIVGEGEEGRLIEPAPLRILPGIFDAEITRLRELNIAIAGDARRLSMQNMETLVGPRARLLWETVRGIDDSPVLPASAVGPTLEADHAFAGDTNDVTTVESALYLCAERLGWDMRDKRLSAKQLAIFISYCDGVRSVRRVPSSSARTNRELFDCAIKGLRIAWSRRVRLRHLRLRAEGLHNAPAQLELFPEDNRVERRNSALDAAVDSLRGRFGQSYVLSAMSCLA